MIEVTLCTWVTLLRIFHHPSTKPKISNSSLSRRITKKISIEMVAGKIRIKIATLKSVSKAKIRKPQTKSKHLTLTTSLKWTIPTTKRPWLTLMCAISKGLSLPLQTTYTAILRARVKSRLLCPNMSRKRAMWTRHKLIVRASLTMTTDVPWELILGPELQNAMGTLRETRLSWATMTFVLMSRQVTFRLLKNQ